MFTSDVKNCLPSQSVGRGRVPVLFTALGNDYRYAESSFLAFDSPSTPGAILNVAGLGLGGGNYG